jgi:glycosyltransferase involved in cell wall biosynthesis
MFPKAVFLAWTAHNRRSQLIAQSLGIPLHLIHALKRRYYLAPLRYLLQSGQTLALLFRERPRMVFVQNPPIFAALWVYLYAKLTGAHYVIDAHSGALLAPWWQWSLPIHAFLSKRAATTLVTNEHLANQVRQWTDKVFILADIPSEFPQGRPYPLQGEFNVAVINTFSPDEPIERVLTAAAALPDVQFYITGDPIRANKRHLQQHPPNVRFTGFLPDADYFGLLRAVQAVLVLTTHDHTMQRGACEAVWLAKPIITSDWPVLRTHFHKGTLHVDNSVEGIRAAVQQMRADLHKLEAEIHLLQQERHAEWQSQSQFLMQLIEEAGAHPHATVQPTVQPTAQQPARNRATLHSAE